MSRNNSKKDKSTYAREEPAGFLEKAGVDYYRYLAKDAGIDIFLQKPINPSVLNDILSGSF